MRAEDADRRAFAAVAYAVVVLLAGSNVPTPLYPVYQRAFGLSPLVLTLVYATYAMTVIPCLLVAGPLSDAVGRRRVLLPAVGLSVVAALVFAVAGGTAWLFAAQVVEGASMAALQGAAVPALLETEPAGDRDRATLVGSSATVGGAAAGPLVAGLVAQYVGWPRRSPYVVEIALLLLAFALLAATLPRQERTGRWRVQRPSVPPALRGSFALAAGAAFLAWALASLFLSLIPSYARELLHIRNAAAVGGLAAVMLGCSAVVQLAGRHIPPRLAQTIGLVLVTSSAGALLVVAAVRSLAAIVVASALAGLGLGLVFRGALAEVGNRAPEDRRGDVIACFYVVIYLGTAVPVIGVGVTAHAIGLLSAVRAFDVVVGTACLAALAARLASARRRRLRPDACPDASPDACPAVTPPS